jgi:hypothetical protein
MDIAMAKLAACSGAHPAIVAGVCPFCQRTISGGHVLWHFPARSTIGGTKPPTYAALLPLSLLADAGRFNPPLPLDNLRWEYLQRFVTLADVDRGTELQPWEAERVEGILAQFEDDLWLRALLLGYYLLRRGADVGYDQALPHILWTIEHAPASPIAVSLGTILGLAARVTDRKDKLFKLLSVHLDVSLEAHHLGPSFPMFASEGRLPAAFFDPINAAWNRVLAERPGDVGVIRAAAAFFIHFDRVKTGKLLREGKALEPDDGRWSEWLASVYQHEMESCRHESRADWAAMALAEWEFALARCRDDSRRVRILCQTARCAFDASHYEKARTYALEMIDSVPECSSAGDVWTSSHACHLGHQLLGRVALRTGNTENAKLHLMESINASGGPHLGAAIPLMTLAKELLERGERRAVRDFLQRCAELHAESRTAFVRWVEQIDRGETPDFTVVTLQVGPQNPLRGRPSSPGV